MKSSLAKQDLASITSQFAKSRRRLSEVTGDELVNGGELQRLRKAKRWTQGYVRDALKEQEGATVISLRGYQLWESSSRKHPKGIHWQNVLALAKLFEVEPQRLIYPKEETPDLIGNLEEPALSKEEIERIDERIDDLDEKLDEILEILKRPQEPPQAPPIPPDEPLPGEPSSPTEPPAQEDTAEAQS